MPTPRRARPRARRRDVASQLHGSSHPSPIRPAARSRGEVVREDVSKYGLIGLLLLMPVAYGIQDLQDDGNLVRLATNIKDGLSNGAIWALIAIGYTLVYGIIELINFAHGDVFMIGTFVSFGLFGTHRADGRHRRRSGLVFGLLLTLRDRDDRAAATLNVDDRAGRLPAAARTRPSSRR